MAQTFGRYERFKGHLISAVSQHFVCAECRCNVVYRSLIGGNQQIACIRDVSHQGLLDIEIATREIRTQEHGAVDLQAARKALWGE